MGGLGGATHDASGSSLAHAHTIDATSARVKSYQLVKVVSGGRACGKSLILASTQLLVIE